MCKGPRTRGPGGNRSGNAWFVAWGPWARITSASRTPPWPASDTQKKVFAFDLADLIPNKPTPTCALPPLEVLRALFTDPARLKPDRTTAEVTEGAAAQFSKLAESLRSRGVPSERAAHFLMRLLFCLFSEDIGLLPAKLFSRLVHAHIQKPAEFTKKLKQLFSAMSGEEGGFGEHDIAYFNCRGCACSIRPAAAAISCMSP
jgi:hypothetical protein